MRLRLMAFGGNKPRVPHDFVTTVPRAGRIAYPNPLLDRRRVPLTTAHDEKALRCPP